MRRNLPIIFAILLLGILVLCSACVVPESEKPGFNGGLSQITTREISPYISFGEAKQEFEGYTGNISSAEKLPVYYILSRDVDRSGNALNWLFGVHQSTGTELLMYDRTGWKIIPWNATLPSEEILLDQVLSPGTLFIRNKDVIFNASSLSDTGRRDLVLKDGIYTLTINSGSTSRTLMFNASTGELIAGNV